MAEKSHGAPTKTGDHTEADGGHGGGFPPFESSTFASQLVSLVIAFVALYLIVSRIALPRVGGVIDARQNAIEGDLAAAVRNPSAAQGQFGNLIFGFAVTEALGIFSLLIALLLLFVPL